LDALYVKTRGRALIISFQDKKLESCWLRATCDKIDHSIRDLVVRKLDVLEFLNTVEELMQVPSCRAERLRGSKDPTMYMLYINESWALVFRYDDRGFHNIWLKQL